MNMAERSFEILKELGLDYTWHDHAHDLIDIKDPVTGNTTSCTPYGAGCLLDFLLWADKLNLSEKSSITPGELKNRKQLVQQLIERARAIGTVVHDRGGDGYSYVRPRFKIPGTRYKFYFYVGNAYDTARPQRSSRYCFAPDELAELEEWVTHDEKIFAECNQKYSVEQN